MRIAFTEAAAIYSPPVDAAMTLSCDFNDHSRDKAAIEASIE
jgi:hypothetical protein